MTAIFRAHGLHKLGLTDKLYICRVYCMRQKLSPQTLLILEAFLDHPADWKYGYDLSRSTGLKSGTLYPILMRLADRKLLQTEWEANEPDKLGKPPRHMYRFTPEGMQFAREQRLSRPVSSTGLPVLNEAQNSWVLG
jgi:PadR family transcriptional regulator, regulatory protein PadR